MEKDKEDNKKGSPPVRLAFLVSYIGNGFYGSQIQVDRRTVEGEFVAACRRLNLFDDWRKAGFLFAGRTDRGVHACGQVAAFSTTEPERAVHTINTQLRRIAGVPVIQKYLLLFTRGTTRNSGHTVTISKKEGMILRQWAMLPAIFLETTISPVLRGWEIEIPGGRSLSQRYLTMKIISFLR